MSASPETLLGRAHLARLGRLWRSAGWPSQDAIELDLIAEGLLTRQVDGAGRECLTVTDAGLRALHAHRRDNRRRLDRHEALCRRTAEWVAEQGRLAFVGAQFRARVGERWRMARPDVYSIRRTTTARGVQPIAYEIKVSRSDLLADLARPEKRAAYAELASRLYYVVTEGLVQAAEMPPGCGLMVASETGFRVLRPAAHRLFEPSLGHWMALLHAQRVGAPHESSQPQLG